MSLFSIQRDQLARRLGDTVAPPGGKKKKTGVLGRTTLHEVWNDIRSTELPSWAGTAPAGVGKAARGKLKADEWRTLCNVSLVHTLGRVWNEHGVNSRHCQLLDNYMDLVTATKLATRRVLTSRVIQEYRECIIRYLHALRVLFPHRRITPNQHLAVHLPKSLADFGPTHAWRCFPFERYNYILQQINTNAKPGEPAPRSRITIIDLFAKERWKLQCSSDFV